MQNRRRSRIPCADKVRQWPRTLRPLPAFPKSPRAAPRARAELNSNSSTTRPSPSAKRLSRASTGPCHPSSRQYVLNVSQVPRIKHEPLSAYPPRRVYQGMDVGGVSESGLRKQAVEKRKGLSASPRGLRNPFNCKGLSPLRLL